MDTSLPFLLCSFVFAYVTSGVKDVPVFKIEGLNGDTTHLPCNVSTYEGDEVVLVLWFREDKGTPIYSVDIRSGSSKAPRRWSDDSVFGERAYFSFENGPGKLTIRNTRESDAGAYRCRVDFLKAQTRNSRVMLTVIVPPEQIIIRDENDVERSTVVGPYSEGDVLILKCEASGGKPSPNLTWFREDIELVTKKYVVPGKNSVQSVITFGPLGRGDLNGRLTCEASNHPKATSVEATVQIDMNFAPLNIRLLGAHQPLSAGRRYDLLCQSAGSRPPAVITWWQNGMRLEKTTETTSSDGNQTTSTLSITFNKSDAGNYLSCKAYNHAVPSEPLEDGWKLDIQYIPEAHVRLGTSLDPNSIREGTDVYFDCLVMAHPPVYRIEWRHNGRPLLHNISLGVIISNHSLVLQGVTRSTAGNYSCVGYNAEGEGKSLKFPLNILYAPSCLPSQPRIYGVAKQEDAKIKCMVDANPPEVSFTWTFNNSAESIDVATSHITKSGTTSIVTYTPVTELDYGTLLCQASNLIGQQRVPCVFHIIAAGRPDQVHNCSLINISMSSVSVICNEGFNGGLPQLFTLEVKDLYSNELNKNITSTNPRFTVSTLEPGSSYVLAIYAFNSKGRSDPTFLNIAMMRSPEKHLTAEKAENHQPQFLLSPVMSLTIGLTLAVMVASFAVILALRIPCNSSRRRQKDFSCENNSRDGSPGLSDKSSVSKDLNVEDNDEKNPDVVPEIIDSDDLGDYTPRRQYIATIDTGSIPTEVHTNNIAQQKRKISSLTLNTSQNIGYCTLRSGAQISMPVKAAPYSYSTSIASCTLPRHSNQPMWSSYCASPKAFKHIQPIIQKQQFTKQAARSQNQGQHCAEISSSINSARSERQAIASSERPVAFQNISPNCKIGKICIGTVDRDIHSTESNCLSDEDISVQTPLMVKHESTV